MTVSLIQDTNGNGIWDAGEPIVATDVTDADGKYSFSGLPLDNNGSDSDYLVWVSDTNNVLGDLTATYDSDGAAPGTGLVTGLGISAVSVSTTAPHQLTQDFAYAPEDHDANEGLIGDTIFLDTGDGAGGAPDGSPNPGEGLEGVLVELYADDGSTLLDSTTTDKNGNYSFGNLDPNGTYTVKVDPNTLPNGGSGLINSIDPDDNTANESVVDLTGYTGGIALDQDFGYTATAPGVVSGTIWDDSNADGGLQPDETGRYAGVTVVLTDSNGNVVATTTTAPDGSYTFPNLPPGNYTVDVTDDDNVLNGTWHALGTQSPPGPGLPGQSQSDPKAVTVSTGVTTVVDFGYYIDGAAVGNFVWDDANNNGIQDAGERGINGVVVSWRSPIRTESPTHS